MTELVAGQRYRVTKAEFCRGKRTRVVKVGDIVEIADHIPDSDGDLYVQAPDGRHGYVHHSGLAPVTHQAPEGTPVYYISGPMTGIPEHNFPAFNAAAAYYRERGYDVINPAEMDDQTEPDWDKKPWSYYLRRDLAELVKATHVVLLPGWERSKGARLEIHVAKELGMLFVPHFPEEIR